MPDIKFIYFDIGGVLLLDFSKTNKWLEMRRDLGISPDLDSQFEAIWQKHDPRICLDYDVDQMIPELEAATGIKAVANYSLLADIVGRFERNSGMWPLAQAAQKKYQVGLLTNMYPRMLKLIQEQQLIPPLSWQAIVDSSAVGHRKPETAIYEIAEHLAKVPADNIFFVDNTPKNLEAAAARGWQTLLYDPLQPEVSSQQLQQLLEL